MAAVYALTTRQGFDELARIRPQRIAFWQHRPECPHEIEPGERWYFVDKQTRDVVGFAIFCGWEKTTVESVFSRFGGACGYPTRSALVAAIRRLKDAFDEEDEIGNVILTDFAELTVPLNLKQKFGLEMYQSRFRYLRQGDLIAAYLGGMDLALGASQSFVLRNEGEAKKSASMRKTRYGQSVFRRLMLEAYGEVCVFTGPALVETLEAAHIQPYVDPESNHICNGLVVRADVHNLFDLGLITIDAGGLIELAPNLKGRSGELDALAGTEARLNNSRGIQPSREALDFRNRYIFQGTKAK